MEFEEFKRMPVTVEGLTIDDVSGAITDLLNDHNATPLQMVASAIIVSSCLEQACGSIQGAGENLLAGLVYENPALAKALMDKITFIFAPGLSDFL